MFNSTILCFTKLSDTKSAYAPQAPPRNRLGRFLLMLLLAVAGPHTFNQLAAATGFAVDLSHWAANGGWQSRWSVLNTSANPLSCTLDLVGPDGQPLILSTTAGNGSSILFTVPLGGTTIVEAGGAGGTAQSGSSTVSCSGAFVANVTYAWMPGGVALTEVTVPPTAPFLKHALAINAFTGLALFAPGTNPSTVVIDAFDLNGNQVGSANVTVPPNGKNIFNLNTVITSLPHTFHGSISIAASHPLEVVAIDVTPGANNSFVLGNVPVIGYNPWSSSLSGTYAFVSGPRSGQSAALTINSISPVGNLLGAASFQAVVTSGSVTGTANVVNMNGGTAFLSFSDDFTPLAGGSAALTQLSNGSFSGSVSILDAVGTSVGTISLH